MTHLKLPRRIYQNILDSLGSVSAEAGGVLAIRENVIKDYYFDSDAGTGKRFYRPSSRIVTGVVNHWIRDKHFQFGGFIHSHVAFHTLSSMDIVAGEMTLLVNRLPSLYMGLLVDHQLYFYKLIRWEGQEHAEVKACTFEIIEE